MRLAVIGRGFLMAAEVLRMETKDEGGMMEVITADKTDITLGFEYPNLSTLFTVCMASEGSMTLDFRKGDMPDNKHTLYVTAESMGISVN